MSDSPDERIPQDPGIPGWKVPAEVPDDARDAVEAPPDHGPPDADGEGELAPES